MQANTIAFDIILDDDTLINEVITNYNEIYHTDFKVLEFSYDEVVRARIEVTTYKNSDLFHLGYQLGTFTEQQRKQNYTIQPVGAIHQFELCTEDGLHFEPHLTGKISSNLYQPISDDEYRRYFNGQAKGVQWMNDGKRIVIFENGIRLFGLPTPAHDKVLVIYPHDHAQFTSPRNAVLYNEDGSIYLQLPKPTSLISNIGKQYGRGANDMAYDHVSWHQKESGEIVLSVRIGFNRDWYEERRLNTDTGALEDELSSGRF